MSLRRNPEIEIGHYMLDSVEVLLALDYFLR
jgi:hypothetical protein